MYLVSLGVLMNHEMLKDLCGVLKHPSHIKCWSGFKQYFFKPVYMNIHFEV